MNTLFEVGKCYAAYYPAANYRGVPKRWELRRFTVLGVRRLTEKPLDPLTRDLNPQLERSAELLLVFDFDKQAERSFYVGSLVGARELSEAETRLPPAVDVMVVHGAKAKVPAPVGEFVKRGLPPGLAEAFTKGFNSEDDGRHACAVMVSPKVSPGSRISA